MGQQLQTVGEDQHPRHETPSPTRSAVTVAEGEMAEIVGGSVDRTSTRAELRTEQLATLTTPFGRLESVDVADLYGGCRGGHAERLRLAARDVRS